MSVDDRQRWDAKYAAKAPPAALAPDLWLEEQVAHLLPGRALELACGLGHNAIWLAQQGWQVDAVDISPVGLDLAAALARTSGVTVHWIPADLDEFTPSADTYDLVCVFRFLDRHRLPEVITSALRIGGRLIYETFTIDHISRPDSGMTNPAFALAPGELPHLYPTLKAICSEDLTLEDRTVARFAATRASRH